MWPLWCHFLVATKGYPEMVWQLVSLFLDATKGVLWNVCEFVGSEPTWEIQSLVAWLPAQFFPFWFGWINLPVWIIQCCWTIRMLDNIWTFIGFFVLGCTLRVRFWGRVSTITHGLFCVNTLIVDWRLIPNTIIIISSKIGSIGLAWTHWSECS